MVRCCTPAHSFAMLLSCLPGAGRSCSSCSSRAIIRCRSSAGSSMTSTRCCRSCRRPRTTSPRRSTRARGARARGTLLPSRQWGVVVSLLLLDVVLLQCGSMCLSSESIVSRLTSNHNLHVRHDSRPHRHLSSLIKRPRQWLRLHEQRSRTVEAVMKVRASARATAATHPRSPAPAPLAQRANEDLGQHEQLPASSDEAQM